MRKTELIAAIERSDTASGTKKSAPKKSATAPAAAKGEKESLKPVPVKPSSKSKKEANSAAKNVKTPTAKTTSAKQETGKTTFSKPTAAGDASKNAPKKSGGPASKPKTQKTAKPTSKLSVFPDADSERIGSEPAKKGGKPSKKSDESEIHEIARIETARSTQDRQRAGFLKEKLLLHKTLETPSAGGRPVQDRLVLLVCGPFWLHTWWEISGTLITRIRAAMGHLWHTADPVLRLYRVWADSAGLIRREYLSDIAIQGGVYNWYISVDNPPGSFLVEIGYKARDGRFFSLVSSNIVETPQSYIHDGIGLPESNWRGPAASFTPDFSPYDQRTQDGPGTLPVRPTRPPEGNAGPFEEDDIKVPEKTYRPFNRNEDRNFDLKVDAEVVIKGKTLPDVQLTIKGERVWLKDDGSFLIRYHLPERRHVFPVVAVSRDGIETKTVVLAVERNTKNLETVIRDQNEEE